MLATYYLLNQTSPEAYKAFGLPEGEKTDASRG